MIPARELSLPAYVRRELDRVEELTGRLLYVRPEYGVMDSSVAVARAGDPRHVLTVNPDYAEYLAHFAVSALAKIRRVAEAPPEQRRVPAVDLGRSLPEDLERELAGRTGFRGDELAGLSRFLFQGTVRQLYSEPIDLRVEREIAQAVPEHGPRQAAYLRRQLQDLVPHFQPAIARYAPAELYAATSGMNVALALGFAECAGIEPDPAFGRSPHHLLGEALYGHVRAVEEAGLPGDRKAVDAWARELDLQDWFEWAPLDQP